MIEGSDDRGPEPAFDRFSDYEPLDWEPTPAWPWTILWMTLLAFGAWKGFLYWNRPSECVNVYVTVSSDGGATSHNETVCVEKADILKARLKDFYKEATK